MNQIPAKSESTHAEMISKIDDLNDTAWKVHITQPKQGLELSSKAKELSEE